MVFFNDEWTVAGFWEISLWEFTTQFSIMEILAWDLQRPLKRWPAPRGSFFHSLC
jgi:hypothetical protein